MKDEHALLGSGLSFPLVANVQGGLKLVTGQTEIEQSIRIILGTMPGERVMRPQFGCRAWELIFAPDNATTRTLLVEYVRQALEFWEPRIDLIDISVTNEMDPARSGAHGNSLVVTIDYQIKKTHDIRSLVYPFYILGEE